MDGSQILGGIVQGTAVAVQTRAEMPLTPESIFAVRELVVGQRVTVSPDGRFAAYVWRDSRKAVSQRDSIQASPSAAWRFLRSGSPELAGATITVRDVTTDAEVVLRGATAAWAPAWAPTGNTLAFLADRDGRSGLWVCRIMGNFKPHRVTSTPLSTSYFGAIAWTADGHSIVVASPTRTIGKVRDHGESRMGSQQAEAAQQQSVEVRRSGLSSSPAAEGPSEASAGTSPLPLPAFESDLVRVDLVDGTVHRLARGMGIDWTQPSPDGHKVAYVTMCDYAPPGSAQYQAYYDVWIVSLLRGEPRQVARHVPLYLRGQAALRWSPDGHYLAYRSSGVASEQALFVVGDDSAPRRLTNLPGDALAVGNSTPVWEADSRHLLTWQEDEIRRFDVNASEGQLVARLAGKTIRLLLSGGTTGPAYRVGVDGLVALATDNSGLSTGFFRVERTGLVTPLLEEDRQLGNPFWTDLSVAVAARSGRIVFTAEDTSAPLEVWGTDGSFAHLTRLSHLGGALWNVQLGVRRIVQWRGADGTDVRGILLLPPDYDSDRRYPLVVWMYEHSMYRFVHTFGVTGSAVFNCHLLATRGIACLYPDLHWERERVMQGLHEQVTAAIQAMVAQGIADSARIGVAGHSSGGYDTFAVLATTPAIKAAVASAGVVDLMTQYGTSRIGPQWVEQQMGVGSSPWAHPERYVANSPSFHMDRVQTPVLILQGTNDAEMTVQMDLAFNLLQHLGRVVEYRRYADEGHVPDLWSAANRLDATKRILDWWAHYLVSTE